MCHIRKGFDSVPHHPLLNMLKTLNVNCDLLRWVAEYLTSRSQCVIVEGDRSSVAQVLSGVTQGYILGALLFLIYIDQLNSFLCLLKAAKLSMQMMCVYTDQCLLVVISGMYRMTLKWLKSSQQKTS